MKTLITFIILFFWGSLTTAEAQFMQNRGMSAPGIHQMIIQHGEDLNLTDEQKQQLVELQTEWRSEVRTPRRDTRVRGDVRTPRRGTAQFEASTRGNRQVRANRTPRADYRSGTAWNRDRFADQTEKVFDILTEEQISELQSIRLDYIDRQHEYMTLRNQTLVNQADIDSEKAGEVLELLNQISESRKQVQADRIENITDWDANAMRNHLAEVRTIHNSLRHLLTVAEYESLMPAGVMGRQGHRGSKATGRTIMRRR